MSAAMFILLLLVKFIAVFSETDRLPRQVLVWYSERVQFKDLQDGLKMHSNPIPGENYMYRALIFNSDLSELYVGGMQELSIVDPSDMKIKKKLEIMTDPTAASLCKALNPQNTLVCFNYVRIIQPFDDNYLFACGTDAKEPKCYFVNLMDYNVTDADPQFSGRNSVPSEPDQHTSWVYLPEESKLLRAVGTEASKTGITYNIQLSNLTSPGMAYDEADVDVDSSQEWLSAPEFVGDSFEYIDHIYFFFREFAIEHINGGRIIYSRVGRVCKNDPGGEMFTVLQKEFTTYQKARLDCSLRENDLEFNYNHMQDVYRSGLTIFAVFTTQSVGPVSSAVCAYRLEEIAELFDVGQVSGQAADGELWTIPDLATIPNNVFQCSALPVPTADYPFLVKYPLMNLDVPNKLNYKDTSTNSFRRESDAPLFLIDDVRLTQIVVDEDVSSGVDVLFTGTERGTIIKAYLTADKSKAYLIEEIDLNANESESQAPILIMLKNASQDYIYTSTDNNVYKVPVQSCLTVNKCKCCCGLDPYCALDNGVCVAKTRGAAVEPCSDKDCNCIKPGSLAVVEGPITVVRHAPCPITNESRSLEEACQTSIPTGQRANLNFAAYAPEGANLKSSEVTCDCEGDTTVQTYTSHIVCSGKEFVTVNTVLNVTSNCICSLNFTSNTATEGPLVTKIVVDTSNGVVNETCMEMAETHDMKIAKYKLELRDWKNRMIEKYCPLDRLRVCADECTQP